MFFASNKLFLLRQTVWFVACWRLFAKRSFCDVPPRFVVRNASRCLVCACRTSLLQRWQWPWIFTVSLKKFNHFIILPGTYWVHKNYTCTKCHFFVYRETSHGFYTDSQWKCTFEEHSTWFTSTFDDSLWPQAVTRQDDPYYSDPDYSANFDSQAQTIWADGFVEETVYCRRKLCFGNSLMHILRLLLNVLFYNRFILCILFFFLLICFMWSYTSCCRVHYKLDTISWSWDWSTRFLLFGSSVYSSVNRLFHWGVYLCVSGNFSLLIIPTLIGKQTLPLRFS